MEYGVSDRAFKLFQYADCRSEEAYTLYTIENEAGKSSLLCYDILPGIQILYSRLNMASCYQRVKTSKGFLQINHCKEGCYELETNGGKVNFLGEGDMLVNDPGTQQIEDTRMPLGQYEGITILFELECAQTELEKLFPSAGIDLYLIRNRLCANHNLFLLRARPEIEHIFSELYNVDERIRETYLLIKVVELLLYLSIVESKPCEAQRHFSQQVIDITREVCTFIVKEPFNKMTIHELAANFNLAETSLRQCFKYIYGQPIASFIRSKRIRSAAELLQKDRNLSIGQIALIAGYENQSKFASAFKADMEQTPLAYRRLHQK